jgi:type IX secretion system PorP/SprF family membrane protein
MENSIGIKYIKKNFQYYFVILLFLGVSDIVFSQQNFNYTQYTYSMSIVNPAYAGSRESLSVNVLWKTQWLGIEGAPKTSTLSIHSPLGEKVGLGFSAVYDEVGPLKDTHLYGDFSYAVRVSLKGQLAFGLKGGVSLQNINSALFMFNENESFDNDFENKVSPNFGVGVYYFQDFFYVGASIPRILDTNFSTINSGSTSRVSKNTAFFITSGYVFEINRDLKLKPSTMIRYSKDLLMSIDVSATAFIKDKLEIGASYRHNESINFMAGVFVSDSFRIGYSYDYTIGDLSTFNNGSHEILFLFDLPLGKRIKRGIEERRFSQNGLY